MGGGGCAGCQKDPPECKIFLKLEVITDQCSAFGLKLAVGIEVGFFFIR